METEVCRNVTVYHIGGKGGHGNSSRKRKLVGKNAKRQTHTHTHTHTNKYMHNRWHRPLARMEQEERRRNSPSKRGCIG